MRKARSYDGSSEQQVTIPTNWLVAAEHMAWEESRPHDRYFVEDVIVTAVREYLVRNDWIHEQGGLNYDRLRESKESDRSN